jgi:hypothetical protein
MTTDSSTLTPAQVASAMVAHGVAKHRTRLDKVLFKAVLAGVFLSFGGLLSEVVSGGAPGLTASNPGLVKLLGGFVFPVGLVMYVAVPVRGGWALTTGLGQDRATGPRAPHKQHDGHADRGVEAGYSHLECPTEPPRGYVMTCASHRRLLTIPLSHARKPRW